MRCFTMDGISNPYLMRVDINKIPGITLFAVTFMIIEIKTFIVTRHS